uniref:Uncharacterized protein n=1 Tax=Anguilla anguilla TaxID=7936 RepID=A0A0E9XG62_ANGAN
MLAFLVHFSQGCIRIMTFLHQRQLYALIVL